MPTIANVNLANLLRTANDVAVQSWRIGIIADMIATGDFAGASSAASVLSPRERGVIPEPVWQRISPQS